MKTCTKEEKELVFKLMKLVNGLSAEDKYFLTGYAMALSQNQKEREKANE